MKLATFLLICVAPAALADDADVKIDGRIATEARLEGLTRGRSRSELVAELKTRRDRGWRAQAEVRGRSDAKDVRLREAFIDYRHDDRRIHARVGQAKKILGLDYERGESERIAPEHAAIYRKLESLSLVGRETVARLAHGDGHSMTRQTVSLGYAEARDVDIIYSFQVPLPNQHHVGSWLLAQVDRIEEKEQFIWSCVASYWYDSDELWLSAEWFAGKDPYESHFASLYDNAKAVHFSAMKFEIAPTLAEIWQPFAQLSGILHNLEKPESNTLTAMLGINWRWKPVKIAAMLDIVGTNSELTRYHRDYDDSLAQIQGTFYF